MLWTVAAFLGVFLLVSLLAARMLFSISHDLRRAQTLIQTAGVEIQDGHLADARTNLASAEQLLINSNDRLYAQVQFDLISWVPGVDENLSSLQDSVALALEMVHGGREMLELTQPLEDSQGRLEVSMDHGKIPLSIVQSAEQQARDLAAVLPTKAEAPSTRLVVGPVAERSRCWQTSAVATAIAVT